MADQDSTSYVERVCEGAVVKFDPDDAALLANARLRININGYAFLKIGNRTHLISRFLMDAPDSLVVDHINGDKLDNRRRNLRVCTHAQNLANGKSHVDSKSKYRGVSYRAKEGKWRAQIGVGVSGRSRYLGHYSAEEEAARAYDAAAAAQYGEYARLNFPAIPPASQPYLTREERRALGLPMKRDSGPERVRTSDQTIMRRLSEPEGEI